MSMQESARSAPRGVEGRSEGRGHIIAERDEGKSRILAQRSALQRRGRRRRIAQSAMQPAGKHVPEGPRVAMTNPRSMPGHSP